MTKKLYIPIPSDVVWMIVGDGEPREMVILGVTHIKAPVKSTVLREIQFSCMDKLNGVSYMPEVYSITYFMDGTMVVSGSEEGIDCTLKLLESPIREWYRANSQNTCTGCKEKSCFTCPSTADHRGLAIPVPKVNISTPLGLQLLSSDLSVLDFKKDPIELGRTLLLSEHINILNYVSIRAIGGDEFIMAYFNPYTSIDTGLFLKYKEGEVW